jgi:hypothetical protein
MSYDEVKNPQHYTSGEIEFLDALKSSLTNEEWRGFLKGNVMKYVWREGNKGGPQDLAKAMFYLSRLNKQDADNNAKSN